METGFPIIPLVGGLDRQLSLLVRANPVNTPSCLNSLSLLASSSVPDSTIWLNPSANRCSRPRPYISSHDVSIPRKCGISMMCNQLKEHQECAIFPEDVQAQAYHHEWEDK